MAGGTQNGLNSISNSLLEEQQERQQQLENLRQEVQSNDNLLTQQIIATREQASTQIEDLRQEMRTLMRGVQQPLDANSARSDGQPQESHSAPPSNGILGAQPSTSSTQEKFTSDLDQSLIAGRGFASSVCDCAQYSFLQFDQDFSGLKVKHADWDASHGREKLKLNIEAHATSIRSTKLSELIAYYKKQLTEELAQPIESFFDFAEQSTWPSIRKLYNRSIEKVLSEFTNTLSGFELDSTNSDKLKMDLKHHARDVVEYKSREEAGKILTRLKDRFLDVFDRDNDSLPRVWTGNEDIKKITKDSRIAALKVLSIFIGIRLDEKVDQIESILNSALIDTPTAKEKQNTTVRDPLSSNIWEEIPPENTLISPSQCKSLWKKFIKETDFIVYDKMSIEGALRRNNVMPLISWKVIALATIIFLVCMISPRNPQYILAVFIVALMVFSALRIHRDNIQLDNITRQFQHVMVAGLFSILSRPRLTPRFFRVAHHRECHCSKRCGSCRPFASPSNRPRSRRAVRARSAPPNEPQVFYL